MAIAMEQNRITVSCHTGDGGYFEVSPNCIDQLGDAYLDWLSFDVTREPTLPDGHDPQISMTLEEALLFAHALHTFATDLIARRERASRE